MQDLHFRCLEGTKGSVIGEFPSGMVNGGKFFMSALRDLYIRTGLTVFPAKTTLYLQETEERSPQPSSTISSISKGIEVKSEVSTARTTAEAKDARNAGGNS